jgi:hypothetical protein
VNSGGYTGLNTKVEHFIRISHFNGNEYESPSGKKATVTFTYKEDSGQPKTPVVQQQCAASVAAKTSTYVGDDSVVVDEATLQELKTALYGKPFAVGNPHHRWRVVISRAKGGDLLLGDHPDPNVRLTALVTYLTGIFAILPVSPDGPGKVAGSLQAQQRGRPAERPGSQGGLPSRRRLPISTTEAVELEK